MRGIHHRNDYPHWDGTQNKINQRVELNLAPPLTVSAVLIPSGRLFQSPGRSRLNAASLSVLVQTLGQLRGRCRFWSSSRLQMVLLGRLASSPLSTVVGSTGEGVGFCSLRCWSAADWIAVDGVGMVGGDMVNRWLLTGEVWARDCCGAFRCIRELWDRSELWKKRKRKLGVMKLRIDGTSPSPPSSHKLDQDLWWNRAALTRVLSFDLSRA